MFLVLSAAAVGLAGCTSESSEAGPPSAPASAAPRDPDARIREEVAASEVALIAAYRSAIGAHPELAADLGPFLVQHEAHLARVAPGFVSDVATPVGSASASASPSSSSESSEAGASSVLAELAAAESAAQAQRATACDAAQYPGLARDLCLIAASEAQHAAALDDLGARGSGS